MRNGGRIVEAAKGTITDIDQRLANALIAEKRRAEEARRTAERRKEEARLNAERHKVAVGQAITKGEQELVALEKLLTEFRRDSQVAVLYKAMKGVGTREKSIIDVLGSHSSDQRLQIKNGYKTRYRKVSERVGWWTEDLILKKL